MNCSFDVAKMNQQQRAGKHPSFSRDRKPPGLHRETFLKRLDVPKPKERKRKEKNASKTFAVSASTEVKNDFFSLIQKMFDERQTPDYIYNILGCLGVEPVCQETIDACLAVSGNLSWVKTFVAGHFREARSYLLHVAVQEATVSENFDLISRLLPQILDRKLVICTLSTAASVLTNSQLFLRFVRSVDGMKEQSTDLYLKEALGLKEWLLLTRLLKAWHSSRRATEAIADSAIIAGRWELVKLCVGLGVDKALRNRALAEALKSRQWDTVLEFFQRGDNIAEACAENGLRLNDRVFRGQTILHDAIVCKRSVEIMELLLQAGADPDVADTFGETALHAAVKRGFWSGLRLLLRYSKAAGKIASARIQQQCTALFIWLRPAYREGSTLLHVLCEEGQADIVHTLLLMTESDPLVRDDKGNTLMMATSEAAEGRENVYRALIQSGISTHQAIVSESLLASLKERKADVDEAFSSPMKRAVERGQLGIAKMLYASGACSNREVHELSTSPTIRLKARRDVLKFVQDISSQPRRLRDLCSLTVSHLIGCGAGRDDRAARAGLPPPVRRQVLLEHVTDPAFLNDCLPPLTVSHVSLEGLTSSQLLYVGLFCLFLLLSFSIFFAVPSSVPTSEAARPGIPHLRPHPGLIPHRGPAPRCPQEETSDRW